MKRRGAQVLAASALIAAASAGGVAVAGGARPGQDWPDYLGGADSSQFSPLDQVNRGNVAALRVAWRYDFPGNGQSNANPLVIGDRMYVPSSAGIVALDAASGRQLWSVPVSGLQMRGLSSWLSADGRQRRIFYTAKDRLHAIDAVSGAALPGFGDRGSVDLRIGLDRDPASLRGVQSQSPGRVYRNLIMLGSTGGLKWNAPPGYIRAYDVLSGKLVWTFHTIPHPGEANYREWPADAWKTVGGANNWSELTLDEANGILFVPLSSAKYNFYGANRIGNNLYANSLVALDARTGRRLWHFQTVHHDLWDYDLPQAPKLLTLMRGGRRIDAVAVASKTGFVFTFERRTGKPVFPIEERPVPQSDVPGERTSPTQPFPSAPPPFARQRVDADTLSPYMGADERAATRALVAGLRNEGIYTPPSLRGTMEMPGSSGGTNWGNGAADGKRGRFYVVSIEIPSILKLEKGQPRGSGLFLSAAAAPGEAIYTQNCAACHGAQRQGQPPAIPSLVGVAQRLSPQDARDVIQGGRKMMPAFSIVGAALNDLLSYLGFAATPATPAAASPEPGAAAGVARGDPADPVTYKSGYNFLFTKAGLPANAPPWSTLTAYDMNAGKIRWQVPYGALPGMKDSGTIFPRGTIAATAGGLVFGASQDRKLRAWDADSGKILFEADLPSTPAGVPAVYMVGGRELIAVPVASYDPKLAATVSGAIMPQGRNGIVVFALPEKAK